jgi:predicted ATPase
VLVVLDNCEHLVDAVADFVRLLLQLCPNLVVAGTSRERLGLRAERVYAVPSMAPSDGELLFLERASAVASEFIPDEHVAAICEAVDGLPLAIELAAARVRSLSPQSIRERLGERLSLLVSRDRDLDERQRTLEATIGWSYDLLDPEEQRALRALSVFAGGCRLDAAEAVAGADLDLLDSLLDKSLIRHRIDDTGNDRYWMLETIREYALARCEEAGEGDAVRATYRDHYLRQAVALSAVTPVVDVTELTGFRVERANYRVVLLDALARGDGHTALALFAALGEFWRREGEVVESYAMMEAALALPGADDRDRAEVLRLAALCATELADYPAADRLLDQAETYLAVTDDPLFTYRVFSARAFLSGRRTDYRQMIEWSELALKAAREAGSDEVELRAEWMLLQHLRVSATDRDEPDRSALEHCLPIAYELLQRATLSRNTLTQAYVHGELSSIFFGLGRFGEALPHAQTALRLPGFQPREVDSLVLWIGLIAGRLGEYATAIKLTTAACRQYESDGYGLDSEDRRYLTQLETDARSALGDAKYNAAHNDPGMTFQDSIELALTVTVESQP